MDVIVVKFLVIAIMFLLLLILMIAATWSQMRKGEGLVVVAHNWRIVVAEVRVLSVSGAHHNLPKAGELILRF